MSYGPPPTKTPYGDQDFIKEDWSGGGPPMGVSAPPVSSSPYSDQYRQHDAPYSQATPPRPSSTLPNSREELKNIATSLTPEDLIFMRSWRKDSFYQRVLPLAIVSNGAYFYYNRSKQLPHRIVPYFLITSSAYILGKWSFRGELRRRLEANPSQTPFMMTLRTISGMQGSNLQSGEFTSDMSQDSLGSGFGSSNALPPPNINRAYTRRGAPSASEPFAQPYGQGTQEPQPLPSYEPDLSVPATHTSPGDEIPRSTTSYEELRARNRGLMQK